MAAFTREILSSIKVRHYFNLFQKFPIETQDMFKSHLLLNPGEG